MALFKAKKAAAELGIEDGIITQMSDEDFEAALAEAEKAIDAAYATGKAERGAITQAAQLDAAEAVAMAGIAMESDYAADEAAKLTIIAERAGDRASAKSARAKEREARKQARHDHRAATKSARQAYNAIKFSEPGKMGFMRAVQVIFAVHIASVIIFLVLTSRDAMVYDVSSIMDWIMIILEGIAFWMFINRYKVARPFVIGMGVLGLVVQGAYDIVTNQFNPFGLALSGAFYIFLILYFALSKRVKATLVNDFTLHKGDYESKLIVGKRLSWPFIRNLVIYFIVFSVVGHWMEMGLCQFIIMGLVEGDYDPTNTLLWRDVLYPFPMEGAAVVVIALVLYPLKEWMCEKIKIPVVPYIISFITNALLCTVIEFGMGLIVNADHQLWDYTNNFGNIMGQVCLQNTMAFGVAASIICWFVYPLLERWLSRLPRNVMNIVFIAVLVFGAIIWSLYIIDPPEMPTSNETAIEETDPKENLSYNADLVGFGLSGMEREAAKLPPGEAEAYQQQIDDMQAILQRMQESLNATAQSAQ